MSKEQTQKRELIYSGKVIALTVDQVLLPNGKTAEREVVLHPGAVALLAENDQHEVLMVRQYRYATGEDLWELPAGKLEPGEKPHPAALRELAEETGFTAENLTFLYQMYTAPGFSNERLLLYQASGLHPAKAKPDDDEFISVQAFSREEIAHMVEQGEIKDGKTLVGLLHYLSH
jgi:ADP-ribose pyrophosphatase